MDNDALFLLILIWSLLWKACAVWFAVKDEKKVWFWILLIGNFFGLLEIIYIFGVTKRKWSDVKNFYVKKPVSAETPSVEIEAPKAE